MKYYFLIIFFITQMFGCRILNQKYSSGKIEIISMIDFSEYTFMNGLDQRGDTLIIYGEKELINNMNIKSGEMISTSVLILRSNLPIFLPEKVNKMFFGREEPCSTSRPVILSDVGYRIYELNCKMGEKQ